MSRTHHSAPTVSPLGELSINEFLRDYWQKKPLLVKQAFPDFPVTLSPDELAGFSLDSDCQARIVEQHSDSDWRVKHGPFSETAFSSLPESHWSLLVQNIDAMDEEVNELLQAFRFLPNWRIDDVMASYATLGGGVGPHFDYYDVFLIQGMGKRRWRIGQYCDASTALIPNQDMKLLQHFECSEDWLVETGDLLYIPAQIAHWGESLDNSLTYSIGFRSPSFSELLLDCTHHLNQHLEEDQRYRDGNEIKQYMDPGRIPEMAIQELRRTLIELVDKPEVIADWIGEYATQLRPQAQPELLPLDFASVDDWHAGKTLSLSSFNRAVYIERENTCHCYINGNRIPFSVETAKKLCEYRAFNKAELPQSDAETIAVLISEANIFVLHQQQTD